MVQPIDTVSKIQLMNVLHNEVEALFPITFIHPNSKEKLIWHKVKTDEEIKQMQADLTGERQKIEKDFRGYNVYITPAVIKPDFLSRNTLTKPSKTDMLGSWCRWVDIDPPDACSTMESITEWQGVTIEKLKGLPQVPTVVVNSGRGLQAYWVMDAFENNRSIVEGQNKGIMTLCEGMGKIDTCQSIDHLMRATGYKNIGSEKKRAKGYTEDQMAEIVFHDCEKVYSSSDIKWIDPCTSTSGALEGELPRIEDGRGSEFLIKHYPELEDRFTKSFQRLVDLAPEQGAQSERAFAIACTMIRAGIQSLDVVAVLMSLEWENKKKYTEPFFRVDVARAIAKVAAGDAVQGELPDIGDDPVAYLAKQCPAESDRWFSMIFRMNDHEVKAPKNVDAVLRDDIELMCRCEIDPLGIVAVLAGFTWHKMNEDELRKKTQEVQSKLKYIAAQRDRSVTTSAGIYAETTDGEIVLIAINPDTKKERVTPITNFTARIVKDVKHSDGVESHRVFCMRSGDQEFDVAEKDFADLKWVGQHLGPRASVLPGGAIMREHARFAIKEIGREERESQELYTHTGWLELQGEWVYLHGNGAIGANGSGVKVRRNCVR